MSRPLSLYYIRVHSICVINSGLKNTLSGNFQKSGINTYTWNLGMYDTLSER